MWAPRRAACGRRRTGATPGRPSSRTSRRPRSAPSRSRPRTRTSCGSARARRTCATTSWTGAACSSRPMPHELPRLAGIGREEHAAPDAGKTWKFMGLGDVGQISRVVVDPTDPDVVFVGAIGHAWAPNPERGVYRTADGGKTWQKVLFVNDTTGVADLIMVPGNPRMLFAGMWQ